MLQAVVVDNLVQDFFFNMKGLEVQLEKSVAPVDDRTQSGMAAIKATIGMMEDENQEAKDIDPVRKILEKKKEAADKQFKQDIEKKMSKAYEELLPALYKGIKEKHPYAAAKWSAAIGSYGGHATSHA